MRRLALLSLLVATCLIEVSPAEAGIKSRFKARVAQYYEGGVCGGNHFFVFVSVKVGKGKSDKVVERVREKFKPKGRAELTIGSYSFKLRPQTLLPGPGRNIAWYFKDHKGLGATSVVGQQASLRYATKAGGDVALTTKVRPGPCG